MNQNKVYNEVFNNIERNFKNKEINVNDIPQFKQMMDKNKLIQILKEIINDDFLLEKIANRSYTHALGFDKIVLIDLKKDLGINNKVQLRFHIWDNKNDALSVLEAMHEHSFNFVSLVLSGKLENQSFDMNTISPKLNELYNKFKIFLDQNPQHMDFLNEQIEIIEAIKLSQLDSAMLIEQNLLSKYQPSRFEDFGFTEKDMYELTKIQGHYVSDRVSGQRDNYKHILKEYLEVEPIKVEIVNEGNYYFHPYKNPHRLYYDREILNSTVLLTTPILSNPQGGSLQRPTYQKESEKGYKKIKLTKDTLKEKLINYIKEVEK